MRENFIAGGLGLLFGLVVQKCGFTRREGVRHAVLLNDFTQARTWLYTLGLGMLGTAVLCYLAVIDVDMLDVLPLHSGVMIGGILTGVGVGLAGALPSILMGGIGGGAALESLCGLAGCVAALLLARQMPLDGVRSLTPVQQGTLFRLTLKDEWLLDSRFVGLGCLGVLICVLALLVRPKYAAQAAKDPLSAALQTLADPAHEKNEEQQDDDELVLTDALEDEVEEIDEDDEAALHEAEAQSVTESVDPTPVDDLLPEIEEDTVSTGEETAAPSLEEEQPRLLPQDDEAWISRQMADRPSPMMDEALDELEREPEEEP